MLFVSQFRKAVAVAIDEIESVITAPSDYLRVTIGTDVSKVLTPTGQVKMKEIFTKMSCRQSEVHSARLDDWVIGPDMPKVVSMSNWQLADLDPEDLKVGVDWLENNRLEALTWISYMYEIALAERQNNDVGYAWRVSNYRLMDLSAIKYSTQADREDLDLLHRTDQSQVMRSLRMLRDRKVSKESYELALGLYKAVISDLNKIMDGKKVSGISKLFLQRPGQLDATSRNEVKDAAKNLFDKIKNGLSSRTWGFEIEVPDAKGVNAPAGIEKGDDGSLRSENHSDCECDCSECVYHECNCDVCEYGSDDPQHCGDDYCTSSADSAEYRSTGGIQRVLHVGMIELCDELVEKDAEINSSAGTHIHVYGQDLSTNQVGQVLATYHWLYNNIFWPIAGRNNNQYAKPLVVNDIANALRRRNPVLRAEKPLVVNVTNLLNERGTIEFRHQNCNLDSKLISTWAWLVRGLVEVAKRGATFTHFKECKSLEDMLAVYAKFNFTPESENPGLVIVGSRSDQNRVEKVVHKVLTRS